VQRKTVTRGEQLEYTVEFEIYPEVKRFDLTGTHIERPVVAVSDEGRDRTLETIRKQRATWKPVEREARLGDRVTIDFVGRLNGKEFEGGKATAFTAGAREWHADREPGTGAGRLKKRRIAQRHGQVFRRATAILCWPGSSGFLT